MFKVERMAYRMVRLVVALLLGAGWAAYGLIGSENSVFLTVMVVATIILGGGAAILLQPHREH